MIASLNHKSSDISAELRQLRAGHAFDTENRCWIPRRLKVPRGEWAAPNEALAGQDIFGAEALVIRDTEIGQRQRQAHVRGGERIQTNGDEQHVRSAALLEKQHAVVVGGQKARVSPVL